MNVAVIIPALNEAESIGNLIEALLAQTRRPDEIIVSDGGSSDGTRAIVESCGPPVRLVIGPGGISENRNAAIAATEAEIIACTDAGCIPDADWLEKITAPFADGAKWVAGLSRPAEDRPLQAAIGLSMMPVPDEIDVDSFVPGGASQAFLRQVWEQAGGFPEGMAAGEDTVFGEQVKSLGIRPIVVKDAQVVWQAPTSLGEMVEKSFRWGRADGLAATGEFGYVRLALFWLLPGLLGLIQTLRRRASGPLTLAAMVGAGAWKTRTKQGHLRDPRARLALPVLYSSRVMSQTVGWITGFHRSPDRDSWSSLAMRVAAHLVALGKRLVRPLIPDGIMIRLRRAEPVGGRQNVDIMTDRNVQRWLDATPDTYRVGPLPPSGRLPEEVVFIPSDPSPDVRTTLEKAFHGPEVEAAVLTVTQPPRIDLGRVNEPHFDPLHIAVSAGSVPSWLPNDPSSALHMIRQAGLHLSVVPLSGDRPRDSRRLIGGPGAVLLCGTVPMHDIGGGSRGAQMAHELVAAGYHVTYLNLFESDEAVDLGLRYSHPNLDQIPADDFDFARYRDRLTTNRRLAILELPHPRYFATLNLARLEGFKIAYDLMDDWSDDALGGWGYTRHDEMETIRLSDGLVASAPSLVARLESMSGRSVSLVPNAVNTRLFRPGEHDRPDDLPAGNGPVFEYHGSLYGDWFDWRALERSATEHPDARFVIIGDDRNRKPMPSNVHFLGLKPQHLLPAYLAHTDVALIPFEVSETTHAVSPLKVFEYLAMGVRVASVPLAPVVDLPGVSTDLDLSKAIDIALASEPPDHSDVARDHSWKARMRELFSSLGAEYEVDDTQHPLHITQHDVTRWAPEERRIAHL